MNTCKLEKTYDVIVVGCGLAGLQAAIYAAKDDCSVLLVSSANLFSGSSFYPGTWGLGLVSANGEQDVDNFIKSIYKVGNQINDLELVETLVKEELKAIQEFEEMGLPLLKPQNANQNEFIPCFDYKNRNWYGLQSSPLESEYQKLLSMYDVDVWEHATLVDFDVTEQKIRSVYFTKQQNVWQVLCKSLVLATGGVGNIFNKTLNTNDITGIGHYLCMKYGCELINMEFMQMMFGYEKPVNKVVFNEKVFKYTDFFDCNKIIDLDTELLKVRSTYGPFTSRLPSKEIDIRLVNVIQKSTLRAKYQNRLLNDSAEFIKTYFDWLKNEKKVNFTESFTLQMYYHAANGGVKINKKCETNIKGVYGCGEFAGGIHGADRIGGLASASAITFGRIAGIEAASYSKNMNNKPSKYQSKTFYKIENAKEIRKQIQVMMQNAALVIRNEKNIQKALKQIEIIEKDLEFNITDEPQLIKESTSLLTQIDLSKSILNSCMLRKESRGSHYREDYPLLNETMNKNIITYKRDNDITTRWES